MSQQVAAKVLSVKPLELKDARWITLVEISYQEVDGKVRRWEAAQRTTRPSSSNVDAVHVVAMLEKPTGPEILLQKQFRPPLDKICIEFPAGLVDKGETPEEAAIRELREETGYIGDVITDRRGGRPVISSAPGSSNAASVLIHIKINMEKPENQNPKPKLEDGEFIECFSVPLKELYSECGRLEAQGFAIDGKVGAFAEGIEAASVWTV